ncbi:MAG: EAL domain-containing protein [Chloroflexi bacterium]|nr:MAG: EAL domain-containing protein [Chloroflexota bacterium]
MTTSGLDVVGRTREVPVSWRLGVTGGCYLGYLGLLAPLWAALGPGTAVLAVLPVVVAGITLGAVPGAVVALLAYFGGAVTLMLAGHAGAAILVTPEGIPMLVGLVAVGLVVGRLRDLGQRMEQDREGLQLIFENTSIGVGRYQADGRLEQGNPALLTLLDEDAGMLGSGLRAMARDSRRRVHREIRYTRRDGSEAWVAVGVVKAHGSGEGAHSIATVENITVRKVQEAALEHMALHDPLTGLPNRTLLGDRLRQALLTAQRDRESLSLLIMDIDRFKEINDTLGHHIGDLLLQETANRLRECLRDSDTVARLGGDEFAVILPAAGEGRTVERMAAKLVDALAQPFVIEATELRVDLSIGAAMYPAHGDDVSTLTRLADIAMYEAKRSGTGFAVYSADAGAGLPLRLALASQMPAAMDKDQLVLHFQPKAAIGSGRPVAIEALVRWEHPSLGLLPPDRFIPLAEETGQIKPLARWVLQRAIAECARWRAAGWDLPVAVNLSGRNLHDAGLPRLIDELLRRHELPGRMLQLEITETTLMTDPEVAMHLLESMIEMGVSVAIDDFGIGYSSLAHLRRLPVGELKIDKSFVSEMTTDPSSGVIVRSTCDLGHNLGLVVLAEGVEDRETWELLREHGVDLAQGYFVSRPLPGPALMEWLSNFKQKPVVVSAS